MQPLTISTEIFPKQLQKLITYLDIAPATFSVECGFNSKVMTQTYLDQKYRPTIKTIDKILKRYPVRLDWLLYDKGEMWETDYFEQRYIKFKNEGGSTAKEKVKNLITIFEASANKIAKRFDVNENTTNNLTSGKTKNIPADYIKKIIESAPYITKDYFE